MTWYAVRTATRQEHRAMGSLREEGITAYLPCETREISHARRKSIKQSPLFPGYLFADLSRDTLWIAQACDGVHKVIGGPTETSRGEPVPASFIAWLAAHESLGAFSKVPWKPDAKWAVGNKVRVAQGKYAGFLGEIVQMRGKSRALLLVSRFGRAQKLERPVKELEAA